MAYGPARTDEEEEEARRVDRTYWIGRCSWVGGDGETEFEDGSRAE
jgi:hypothetical protein